MILALLGLALACPEDPVAELHARAAAIERAVGDLDDLAFDANRPGFEGALGCVTTPLSVADAAAVHKTGAFLRFVDGDMRASIKSWAAYKSLVPGAAMPDALTPSTLMQEHWTEATPTEARVDLDLEPPGGWIVDGVATSSVPVDQAFLLQARDKDGTVYYTGHQVSVAETPIVDLVQPGGVTPRMRRARVVGSVLAIGLAAGAGGAFAVYGKAERTLTTVPYDDIDATAKRGNTASAAGFTLGGAALAAFTLSWGVRW